MKAVNIGLIGYKFMGKAHSHAYHDMPFFFETEHVPVRKVICGRDYGATGVFEASSREEIGRGSRKDEQSRASVSGHPGPHRRRRAGCPSSSPPDRIVEPSAPRQTVDIGQDACEGRRMPPEKVNG